MLPKGHRNEDKGTGGGIALRNGTRHDRQEIGAGHNVRDGKPILDGQPDGPRQALVGQLTINKASIEGTLGNFDVVDLEKGRHIERRTDLGMIAPYQADEFIPQEGEAVNGRWHR